MSAFIGILSLDTRFPRILGDAGHPDSYHLPARLRVVAGAGSPDIVRDGRPAPELVARFIAAAQELEREGAVLITSTCGFLITVQDEIAAALGIPVLLSGLALAPLVWRLHGRRPLGVLTASAQSLGAQAQAAAAIPPEALRIAGLAHSELFSGTFLVAKSAQNQSFDPAAIEAVVLDAGRRLCAQSPEIGAILLECGNLPPYGEALARATGRAVYSILDGARLIHPAVTG